MARLAIHGGPKVKTTPFGTGRRFGGEEIKELVESLEQNTLFYHHGNKVKTFLRDFNRLYGAKYSVAASSGTAAMHVALGAAGISVGDEVITSPITDLGTAIGILYQNAIPVFADVDPRTYNLDPASVEAKITERTKAILVVHLAGNPADMDPLLALAEKYKLKVIEDCAQSFLAYHQGRLVGTLGDYGVFSTNDFKQISTGEGGIVLVNSGDEQDYQRTVMFADKNYNRFAEDRCGSVAYLAPNYRMTELQGAVGIAQLKKLPQICAARNRYGEQITEGIRDLPGIYPPLVREGNKSSYWFYMFRVDEAELGCSRDAFSRALAAEGIPNSPGYIPAVLYAYPMFQARTAYLGTHFPFDLADVDYAPGSCPTAEEVLATAIRIEISEFYTPEDIQDIITAIRKVAELAGEIG